MTLETAARLASEDYQTLLDANGGATWPNLIETSSMACNWLCISQRAWGDACQQLGREQAALCVLVIDRNWRLPAEHRYRGRRPQACLKGIIGKGSDNFNVMGFLRAIEGYQEGCDCDVSASLPSIDAQPRTGVKSVGSLLSNILASFGSDQTGDGS